MSAVAIALGIAATRCSLTTSLDGLAGTALPLDAGADAADARAPDADAADAGKDGGRFCASLTPSPTFCDDFDDEGPFALWAETHANAGSSATRDRGAFRSAKPPMV